LTALYGAFAAGRPSPLPELPLQYADFALWQRERLCGETLAAELAWWKGRLDGAPEVLEIPADRPRPAVRSLEGSDLPAALDPGASRGLAGLVRRRGATLFMGLLAGFQALLGRYTGQEDLLVGTPVANRNRAEVEDLIGFFVNTLVLRADASGDPSFALFLDRVREQALAAYDHQDLPFEKLVEELRPERSLSRPPLVQATLALQNAPLAPAALPGLRLTPLPGESRTAKFDLSLVFEETADGISGAIEYSTDLFEAATIERLAGHLNVLLSAAAAAPETRLSALPVLSEAERRELLAWNETAIAYPLERSLHAWIEDQAGRTPDAVALAFETEELTYGELDRRANRLARRLQALGCGPESRVGVLLERSCELLVALLGILKAGAAYVPLDPDHPADRLAFQDRDARLRLILTRAGLADLLPGAEDRFLFLEHGEPAADGDLADGPLPVPVDPDHPAYVLYTSGSTGRPKGTVISHRAIVNRLLWMQDALHLSAADRVLQKTPFSFDVSVWELFWPLMIGARLVVASPGGHRDNAYLARLIAGQGITVLHFVPSMLQLFLEEPEAAECRTLRDVVCSGEALPAELARRFAACLGYARLHNLYGPTEAAVDVTSWVCKPADIAEDRRGIPIGRPIANTRIHLLDRGLLPVPVGAPGELFIAGVNLARGYVERPDLTAERFLPDPEGREPGGRVYRTGDLARWRGDGAIEYLGRLDHQVKIRGVRIELGEIETALTALPGVREAVVVARGDQLREDRSEKRLVAYVVGDIAVEELRQALRKRLPEAMVPAAFVTLAALPLNANGKVDRKALPAPEWQSTGADAVAPRTPVEEVLAGMWAEVLGLERVGAADHFFHLGGHSLLATQVMSRLRAAFGIEMPLRELFEAPVLAELATRVEAALRGGAGPLAPPLLPVAPALREGPLPLSFSQQRLWFLDQLEPGSALYNIPLALRVQGPLDGAVLALCLGEIAGRHEALRTVFAAPDGSPVQVIRPAAPFVLPLVDLSGLPQSRREETALLLAGDEAARPFDLARGPLLRGMQLRLAEGEQIVALTLHHIASDGWSLGILVREVTALYAAFVAGRPSPLPDLPVQYADFAVWQREWLRGEVLEQQLAWWKRQLADLPSSVDLPMEHPRTAPGTSRRGVEDRHLSPELSRRIEKLGRQEGTTPSMTLLAALAALLHRFTGRDDLVLGMPIAGRTRTETEGLIGFFLNTLALRIDLAGDPTVRELLGRVRQAVLGASDHQDAPFELLLEELRPERDLTRTPLFQIVFNWLGFGTGKERFELPGLVLEQIHTAPPFAKFDLEIYAGPSAGQIALRAVYNRNLFAPPQIDELLTQLEELLAGMVAGPGRRLSALPPGVEQSERRHSPIPANGPGFPRETLDGSIPERFAAQASAHAGRPAVVAPGALWTYAELAGEVDRVAHSLLAQGGPGGRRIALLFSPEPPMVAAILGALAAGATYVPLDPSHPRERLRDVLADSGAVALLAGDDQRSLARELAGELPVLCFGDLPPAPRRWAPPRWAPVTQAYLLYTSGSTGRPKGVLQNHRNVLGHIRTYSLRLGLGPEDRLLLLARYGFDAAVMDLFGALLNGAALCLWDLTRDGLEGLGRWMNEQAVTVYHSTPSVYRSFLDNVRPGESWPALRLVVLGGEEARRQDLDRFREAFPPGCRLVNGLGPTESTLALQKFLDRDEQITRAGLPIGWPVEDVSVRLRNGAGEQPATWGVGEIEISSPYLAIGYWGQPGLTAERFVPDPEGTPGARLYRSGDLARRLQGGELEFLGRADGQVKVRGYRIETGEIEAALVAQPGVHQAVVMAREDTPGNPRLVAYVVGDATVDELRQRLRERLPDPMVPAAFVMLPALPLTPNGKVDRKALPAPAWQRAEDGYLTPRTPVEEIVAAIYAELLSVPSIGRDESFFDLGGHSLLATRVVSRLRSVLGVELPVRALFERPTVAELSAAVEEARRSDANRLAPPLLPVPREGPLPLSFAQQRLWFIDQLEPGSPLYNMPGALRIEGPLDSRVLALCLGEIVRRHEALRTVFVAQGGAPVQVIQSAAPFPLPVVDLSGLPEKTREALALTLIAEEAGRPFDLARGPLLRGGLLRLAEGDHAVTLTLHHIVSDGWSMGILVRELTVLYAAFAKGRPSLLPELAVQYADFSVWQHSWLHGEVLEEETAFWRRQLAGLPPLLELPTDRPRPAVQSFRGTSRPVRLPDELTRQAQALSRHEGATLFMVLLAGFQALLARYSGQDDLAVGSPVAGRNRVEIEGLIGFFVNTLVLRGDLVGEPTFRELLGRVREVALAAHTHQDVPFEKLVQELTPARSLAHAPLFQVMLVLQNSPVESLEIQNLLLRPVNSAGTTAKFDLTLSLEAANGGLRGTVEHATDLFDVTTIDRLISHFERLLAAAAATPDLSASALPFLSPEEYGQILIEWNDTGPTPVPRACLHELFEAQAQRTPDAVALVDGTREILYRELDEAADRLAVALRRCGAGPEVVVGVYLERSVGLVATLLAVLKAGAAYLPVEPQLPRLRCAALLTGARVSAVVSDAKLAAALPWSGPVVLVDQVEEGEEREERGVQGVRTDPENLAYVLYTSGSTGTPKGVAVTHRSAVALVCWAATVYTPGELAGVLAATSLSFDLSVFELFVPLSLGGTVILAQNALELQTLPSAGRVTLVNTVPSVLAELSRLGSLGASVRTVNLAGEPLPRALADRLYAMGTLERVWNLYGPSEDTTYSTSARVARDGSAAPVIGRPLMATRAYVLTQGWETQPVGVPGELYLGGAGLARGYLHRPDFTAERFLPDPFAVEPGARLYRTGDRVRWTAAGELEFLGRLDHQVKIRGFRIELGEIEAALATLSGVRDAVVVAREDRSGGGSYDRRLVAYVTGDAAADALRSSLQERLPAYMVPAAFVNLESLPLTANGKVDRKALPAPARPHTEEGSYIAPRNLLEQTIAEVWQEVLGLDRVGRDNNFFDAGGHSLLMIQVHARLRERLDRDLTVVELFQYPTVQALAEHLGEGTAPLPAAITAPMAPLERPAAGFAVIGMAGRFPGAASVEELWANLRDGREAMVSFTDEEMQAAGVSPEMLAEPRYVKSGPVLEGIEFFDAEFFGFSPREAEMMDPQHRLFLETSWQALEDAGYDPRGVPGRTGVWGGAGMSAYAFHLLTRPDLLRAAGVWAAHHGIEKDFLATRVSYELNLKGPSVAVQTACSTSLVAVHHACRSLASGECDTALAGGVHINTSQRTGYLFEEGAINSPDGHCRAFDAKARGTVSGSGVGVVVLKRLEDALRDGDTIRAVIRGTAINNDGSLKVGFTAPSVDGQAEVIAAAQAAAGVSPDSIGYVEGHGTGTPLGDPIEIAALTRAFRLSGTRTDEMGSCGLGSIKTNIGHLGAAAGVAGLIKTVLALEHRQIPPSLHFDTPNPAIDLAASPFRVVDCLTDWRADGVPRRAGVSSFGIGGTNAHAVLEESPPVEPSGASRPYQLLLLSARTAGALEAATTRLAAWLESRPEVPLADVAYTLRRGRHPFEHRRMLACASREDALAALQSRDPERLLTRRRQSDPPAMAWLLPGQGSQHPGMGCDLYETEPVFRREIDNCAESLSPRLGRDLREILFSSPGAELAETRFAQPALFAVEHALSRLWLSWGLRPQALLGHSLGEYVAACLAGVLSVDDALTLVAARGELMQELPPGAMLSVDLSEGETLAEIAAAPGLSLAAVNGPGQCVASGPVKEIEALAERLSRRSAPCRRLHTSHAFHSKMMEPILGRFAGLVSRVELRPPSIPYLSNLTGTWVTAAEATDPWYWTRHLRETVRFGDGVSRLLAALPPGAVLLEAGPGKALGRLVRSQAAGRMVLASMPHPGSPESGAGALLHSLGRLWLAGVEIDWQAFQGEERRRRVPLPTYPFQRQRFWVEAPRYDLMAGPDAVDPHRFVTLGGGEPASATADLGGLLRDPQNAEVLKRLLDAEPGLRVLLPLPPKSGTAPEPGTPAAPSVPGAGHRRPELPTPYREPQSEIERRLATIWGDLLGIDQVGVHDDFFELGGHSLLATRLLSRLREAFDREVQLATLFAESTIARLATHLQTEKLIAPERPPIERAPRLGPLPLSFAQQRLWFIDQLEPGSPLYNISVALRVEGPLDSEVLALSLSEIARRHETLRTVFAAPEGSPEQVIQPASPFVLPLVDLAKLPERACEAVARTLAGEEAGRPFDLARGPLLRGVLLRLAEGDHMVALTMHHIASDGWSMGILVHEVAVLYAAFAEGRPSPLPELPVQYADFAVWQGSWLQGEILENEISFWRRQLAGLPPLLELPTDRPRPAVQSFRGASWPVRLPAELARTAQTLSRREGATLFMVLLAAFQTLLARYSGQRALAVGSPVAGRNRLEIEGLIGFFVNTLVLHGDLAGEPSFRELLGRVRETALAGYLHQDLPFEKLIEELAPERSLAHSPLFQVMLALQNAPAGSLEIRDLRLRPANVPGTTAKFDLMLNLTEHGGTLAGVFEYSTDLFDAATVGRLTGHFERLLAAAVTRPGEPVFVLPLMSDAERFQVLVEWNDRKPAAEPRALMHELFAAQARRTPEAVAVVCGDRELTYAELGVRAGRLARRLRRHGVGPDVPVGLLSERSPDMIVGVLGILQAGGACLPLDPKQPAQRLAFLLDDTRCPVLLTQAHLASRLPACDAGILLFDGEDEDDGGIAGAAGELTEGNLAYVIYTSGSTGRPKGVALPHGALRNLLDWHLATLLGGVRTLQFALLTFDVSFYEMFACWGSGGTLVVVPEELRRDMTALAGLLVEQRIQKAILPVVVLQQLAELYADVQDLPPLQEITTTGERLQTNRAMAALLRRLPGCAFHNHYGPSETHVATAFPLPSDPQDWPADPPIGRPIWRCSTYVLAPGLVPAPVGVPGDLYIGGVCLARGYLRRPDLTAERFVPDPLGGAPGARLYRTGDKVRLLANGNLEYLGRFDDQVKIRGFRVELGEIEALLLAQAGVREAAVVVREDRSAGGTGIPRLVAYVAGDSSAVTPGVLQPALREQLPDYMVPTAFVTLAALPLTPNGKVDKRALPAPESQRPEEDFLAPRTAVEEILAGIWAELLGLEQVGVADHFFELGGHSLLATRAMSRLRSACGVEMPLRDLFEAPILADLAARIEAALRAGTGPAAPPLVPVPREGPVPLSYPQERLWFLYLLEPESPAFHLGGALRLTGALTPGAFAASLSETVRRHEVLRTRYQESGGGAVQIVDPAAPFPLPLVDLGGLPEGARERELRRLAEREMARPFDLTRDWPLRTHLVRRSREEHTALFTLHHIAGDGWSLGLLTREVGALYTAFAVDPAGRPPALPELAVQYADFAVWQRAWLSGDRLEEQLAWWRNRLAGPLPVLELPQRHSRPDTPRFRGAACSVAVPAGLRRSLEKIGHSEGATLFMVLLAGFKALLHLYSGQEDLLIGTNVANRNRSEVEGLIGLFVNNLVLRTDLSGNPGFRELVRRVRDVTLGALAHQEVPFEKVLEAVQPQRQTVFAPLFQAMFVLQNFPATAQRVGDLEIAPLEMESRTANFDLVLALNEEAEGLGGALRYDTDLFAETAMARMVEHFLALLHSVAEDPDRPLSAISLTAESDIRQLASAFNEDF
ncbi:MAG TPA: non-ribosomal peptide synthase/polyketide synthase, partial [Thermoanaerobaculia bacterium]|nr:non-ribosomal peptide synthase/polyketide synthase [Thermoanaerobaculia bacterium]